MSAMEDRFHELSTHLTTLLNNDPAEAIRQAREINLDLPELDRFNLMGLKAGALVDGGALTQQQDAIEEGLALFRTLHDRHPAPHIVYNLANGLVAATGISPRAPSWLDDRERTRGHRAEARQCFWKVAQDLDAGSSVMTHHFLHRSVGYCSGIGLVRRQHLQCLMRALPVVEADSIADHA